MNDCQFRFVEINGMSLPDPAYAFSVLHEEVTGRYCSPQKAADNLDKYWSSYSEQRACTVLLLDEVDQLVTRKQNVLYKLLDWPTYPFARLIVVAIANTMDLPERLLPSEKARVLSHCMA
jgi:origin recognition complex subunit 1|eukprot:COSAG06_NODE_652_length_13373_cov_9.483351_4_plen_120_part_00